MSVFSYTGCGKSSTFAPNLKIINCKGMKTMKKLAIYVLGVVLMGMTSCSDEPGIKTVEGMYSYKLAGSARVYYQSTGDTRQVRMDTETGTMTIVRTNEANEVKITMSADNGDLYAMVGILTHDTIFFEPVSRDIYVEEVQEMFRSQMNGEGQVLNDGSISARIYITGRAHEEENINLTATDVQLFATKIKK